MCIFNLACASTGLYEFSELVPNYDIAFPKKACRWIPSDHNYSLYIFSNRLPKCSNITEHLHSINNVSISAFDIMRYEMFRLPAMVSIANKATVTD